MNSKLAACSEEVLETYTSHSLVRPFPSRFLQTKDNKFAIGWWLMIVPDLHRQQIPTRQTLEGGSAASTPCWVPRYDMIGGPVLLPPPKTHGSMPSIGSVGLRPFLAYLLLAARLDGASCGSGSLLAQGKDSGGNILSPDSSVQMRWGEKM